MNDLKKRNIGIDFIKIIACIGVVLLHAIGFKASKFNNLLYYLGTISIPLFFMTNGFFILNKDNINIKYLLKKISKFLDIIIFFNVIYWVTTLLIKRRANNIVIQVLKSIIGKGKIYWLWFLSSLIILYIIYPILKKILDNNKINRKFLIILISICEIIYIYNLILGYNEKNIIRTIVPQALRLWTWIFYFYLGGYINKMGIYIEKYANKYSVIVFTLICIIYEFFIARYVLKDLCAENFYDCVLIAIWIALIFAYIYKLNIKERYNTIIAKVSSNTMGVYLIHEFILMGINKVYKFGNGLINILVFIGLFFSAYILTCLLKKVPILNKLFT